MNLGKGRYSLHYFRNLDTSRFKIRSGRVEAVLDANAIPWSHPRHLSIHRIIIHAHRSLNRFRESSDAAPYNLTSQLRQTLNHPSLHLRHHAQKLNLLILARKLDPCTGNNLRTLALPPPLPLFQTLAPLNPLVRLERNLQSLNLNDFPTLVPNPHRAIRRVKIKQHIPPPKLGGEVDHAQHPAALFLLPQSQRLHPAHLLFELDHLAHALVDPQRLLRFERRDDGAPEELVLERVCVAGRLEHVIYPFGARGAEGRLVVRYRVEDEFGGDRDADFAGIEVGGIGDEFGVVRDYKKVNSQI